MIKIKVIDILNKIANGEEITHFKFDDYNFIYDKDVRSWRNENGDILSTYCSVETCLNDEVEIIEDKKIERLQWCNIKGDSTKAQLLELRENVILQFDKINEIIDYINKGE